STVRHFAALLDAAARKSAARCVVAAIGPLTAAALREIGLAPHVTPERATACELVAQLAAHMAEPRDSR
ncbi:MAG: uroporphyrinogen-III synthase, partial [Myxococcales bacterium]|nr:uroporphyrinogen-III synthase [Myxococcales bacterium]